MLKKLFACPHLVSIAWRQIQTIHFLGEQIKEIESEVEEKIASKKALLKSVGICLTKDGENKLYCGD